MTATSKNIESIVKQWTTFDLKTIQHDLDVTTTEIASRADESDQSRRKLVELSREFRKNTNEDVRKAVAPILKSFQGEIDSLSKRSKAAETAFLKIYRLLSELPDPVPALEYAQNLQKRAEKVSDLEVENQKLRETLEEYNHEFADVKNQEVTIKQLREKIKDLEDKTESTIQQRLKEKEKELQRLFAEKERQIQSNQFDLVTKYAEMEMRQKQLQQALDHAHQEMFDYKSKQEDASSARAMEIEILNQDLERAHERASNAERLNEKLREQIDENQQVMSSITVAKSNADENLSQEENNRKLREKLEFELAAKEREIATLVTDTQKLQSTLMKVKETSVTQISDLENVLTAKEKIIAQLENKLQNQADYDEIKRELSILKSIEFSSSNRSDDEQNNSNSPKKSLEILLLEKNRALQSEQTQTKVAYADLENNHSLENMTKTLESPSTNIISLLPSNDNHSLSTPVDTICPTMITPTTQIINSGNKENSYQANENLQVCIRQGPQLNAVQWTKLPCPSPVHQDMKSLEPLDTTHVSTVVRKILAQHNIGQRVFARYVLSLSQGTVSELLSKPKPWSKLTEKGKESYRKMWTWAHSEDSILALRSISPRKGAKDTVQSKVVQILTEPTPSKTSRSSSASSTSSRDPSPSEQLNPMAMPPGSYLPPSIFPSFVPSLLMQTTNRLKAEPYLPYNILCPQPDNYRDWLMLQEIVRNNSLMKQMRSSDESDQSDTEENNNENIDETPLDLSMKLDSNKTSTTKSSTKPILMPLNEQDLVKYRTINTLELVQAIKDILSRYSISQRHFGEKILGLSQGSVSDILARPKSWELLTQKGREPFIRMRLFLDDSNALKQLVQNLSVTSPSLQTNSFLSNENSTDEQTNDCPKSLTNENLITSTINESSSTTTTTTTTTNNNNNNKSKSRPKPKDQIRPQATSRSQIPPYQLPKITLPPNIDTEQLSSQVRELLLTHSIGQRVFGEAVLNLSQGTVSEILSKPRPWHALSVKGREPYIRMYTWFNDTDNVQKLLTWKQERDAFRRNIRSEISPPTKVPVDNDNPSKRRYIFSDEQRRILKQTFENEQYPSQAKLEQLAEELSLPMTKISNWFHNARMRTKGNQLSSIDTTKSILSSSSPPINDDNDDDENDSDSDDETLPTIVPLNSSWLNGTNDSDSSTSPLSYSTTNLSSIDEQKPQSNPISSSSKKQRYHDLDRRCREYEYSNNELKQLNAQLEKDLLSVGGVSELFRRGPEGQTSDSSMNETGIMKDVLNQSSAPIISFNESSTNEHLKKDSTSDEALTAIVISQRERFRVRNVELENENVSLKQQINIFQNEMDKLRSDNIKLYEKIKFVQTYPTNRGQDESIDRYSRGYDASLDPFTNFTKQEKQKKYESLKLHEKFALNFGRFILSSHQSRTFFVIYFILVHILIFLSLYKMVHTGSSVRDMSQVCFDQFREHMAGVHGEKNFHINPGHAHGAGYQHR